MIGQEATGCIDGSEVAFRQFNAVLLGEVDELFQQVEPSPRPLGNHHFFAAVFLRASSLATASRLRLLQNAASTGSGSPELIPSSNSESSFSLTRRFRSSRINSRTYS